MLSVFHRRVTTGLLAALLVLPMNAPQACSVPSHEEITQFDGDRMTGFETARIRGLGEAMLSDSAEERAIVSALFASGETAISTMPDGAYRCRTIKLGGFLPLVTYSYFDCTVSQKGTQIEKLTGSQRFKGSLTPSDGGFFYLGAQHYGDEQPIAYNTNPERNQVGCLVKVSGKPVRYRLELPFPQFESTHDVIELIPAG